jgi:hypothetical protein
LRGSKRENMRRILPSFAYEENLVSEDDVAPKPFEAVPDNISMSELVDGVIRGKYKLDPSQLRVLVAWMPHFAPKLSATAIVTGDGKTFAEALDRCIERSHSPPRLNGPVEPLPREELMKPMTRYRRF